MKRQARFETIQKNATRDVAVAKKMLADLVRTMQLIEFDIAAEEQRSGISDRSDVKYSILAKTLVERYDNLKVTIATLEQLHTERALLEQIATAA